MPRHALYAGLALASVAGCAAFLFWPPADTGSDEHIVQLAATAPPARAATKTPAANNAPDLASIRSRLADKGGLADADIHDLRLVDFEYGIACGESAAPSGAASRRKFVWIDRTQTLVYENNSNDFAILVQICDPSKRPPKS